MRNTDTWRWYLALGGLSVLKALALRNNRRRFRRELLDAGLFVGLGLLLYRLDSDGGSRDGGRLRTLLDGAGGRPAGDRVVRAVDRAEPVVRGVVLPAVRRRLRDEEPEPNRLERLRRRLPA